MSAKIWAVLLLCFALAMPALAADSPDFANRMKAGRDAFDASRLDEAIRQFRAAIQLQPNDSMAHLWLARALGRKTEKASVFRQPFMVGGVRDEFEKSVQLDPKNIDARQDLLEFYLQAPGAFGGGMDKAQAQAAAIEKLDAAEGHIARAKIAEKQERYDIADKEYRAAIEAKPGTAGYQRELDEFTRRRNQRAR